MKRLPLRNRKCPDCNGITGFVNYKDYCKEHADKKITGEIGIITLKTKANRC